MVSTGDRRAVVASDGWRKRLHEGSACWLETRDMLILRCVHLVCRCRVKLTHTYRNAHDQSHHEHLKQQT